MGLPEVRQAMMTKLRTISGVTVPQDPLPHTISDKTIVVFPRTSGTALSSTGRTRGEVAVRARSVLQVEYHRRIPYKELGSTIGDVTSMIDTIEDLVWGQAAGGRFDGTIISVEGVDLAHFGALGWNEWTFGARLEVTVTHGDLISA